MRWSLYSEEYLNSITASPSDLANALKLQSVSELREISRPCLNKGSLSFQDVSEKKKHVAKLRTKVKLAANFSNAKHRDCCANESMLAYATGTSLEPVLGAIYGAGVVSSTLRSPDRECFLEEKLTKLSSNDAEHLAFLEDLCTQFESGKVLPLARCVRGLRRLMADFKSLANSTTAVYRQIYDFVAAAGKCGSGGQGILNTILVIESCFEGETTFSCPGYCIIAPPNMGKTIVNQLYGLGFVDTDNLAVKRIDKEPAIVDRLCKAGVSVLTNRWEHGLFGDRVIYIGPKADSLPKLLESASIFSVSTETGRKVRDNIRKFYKETTKHKGNVTANVPLKYWLSNRTAINALLVEAGVTALDKRPRFDQEKWIESYKTAIKNRSVYYAEGGALNSALLQFFVDVAMLD